MKVIGVTGSIGSGKSFVAGVFASLGAKILDADRLAHGCLRKGTPTYRKMVLAFGPDILDAKLNIDRKALADKVFKEKKELDKLNKIVHPVVVDKIKKDIRRPGKGKAVVIDAPLLIEAGLDKLTDVVIVVKASKKTLYSRCARSLGIGKEECERRLKNQMPLSMKLKRANFVIRNDGTKSLTRRQVIKVWGLLWK